MKASTTTTTTTTTNNSAPLRRRQHRRRSTGDAPPQRTSIMQILVAILLLEPALGFSTLNTPARPAFSSTTRLHYRDVAGHATMEFPVVTNMARGLKSRFTRRGASSVDETPTQANVDDYLEFLERRYKRLHKDDDSKDQIQFSALNWLRQGESSKKAQLREETDALHVLGLAGLSSKRALQSQAASPAELVTKSAAQTTAMPVALAALAARVAPLARKLSVQRKLFLNYQTRKVKQAFVALVKTAARTSSRVGRAVWTMGGGKRSLALLTVGAFLTFFVLRTLSQAVLMEGAASS